jgi:hypothetical protein
VVVRHGLPGLVLGLGLGRRWSLVETLVLTTGASLAGLLVLLGTVVPREAGWGQLLDREVGLLVSEVERWHGRLGMGSELAAREFAQLLERALRVAAPGVVLTGLLLVALVNYLGARLCLRRRGFRPFAEEAVPDHLVWAVILGGLGLVPGWPTATAVGVNILLVLGPLYAIQGLAVLRHLFQRARLPRPLQGVGFGLFALQPLLLVGVACLGLTDLWADFRKIRQAPTPA